MKKGIFVLGLSVLSITLFSFKGNNGITKLANGNYLISENANISLEDAKTLRDITIIDAADVEVASEKIKDDVASKTIWKSKDAVEREASSALIKAEMILAKYE